MIGDVEGLVIDPDRPPLVEGDREQLLLEAGNAAEAALNVTAKFVHPQVAGLIEQWAGFEQAQRADL
jgi:hypothetical protein